METPADPTEGTSMEYIDSETSVIKEDSNTKEHYDPKITFSHKEDHLPKEDPIPKEDHDSKEDPVPKEDPNTRKDPDTKEDPKEQQPNHTNRWSLQEHPNKLTPVRNSPSLGSIPKHKRASKCSKDELSDLPETWDEECQKHLVDFAER